MKNPDETCLEIRIPHCAGKIILRDRTDFLFHGIASGIINALKRLTADA